MRARTIVLLASLLVAPVAAAAEPAVPGSGLLQVIGSLVAVIVLIFLLAWGLRRVQAGGAGPSGVIRVISAFPMGTRERVVLIQVGDEQILVGVGPGGMRTLHVLNHPLELEDSQSADSPFARRLRGMLGGGTG